MARIKSRVISIDLSGILKGVRMSYKITSMGKTRGQFKKAINRIEAATNLVLQREGKKIRDVMLEKFDSTSVYSKPSRKTGRIRDALNIYTVTRDANNFYLKVGSAARLPRTRGPLGIPYWKIQEKGILKGFEFDQKFLPISIAGGDFKLVSKKREWFISRPDIESYTIRVRNPGFRPRGFISAGFTYTRSVGSKIIKEIIVKALKK